MARLADTRTAPVGGWRYIQPETGCEFVFGSLVETVERVIEHRRYKNLTPVDPLSVQIEIERQICSYLSTEYCRPEYGEDYRPTKDLTRELTADKALAFSATAIAAVKLGAFVDKAESERRAAICRGCQFNKSADGCSCTPFYKLVGLLIPRARTEPGISICSACGCSLKAKVLLPMDAIRAGNEGRSINFPAYCWQIE